MRKWIFGLTIIFLLIFAGFFYWKKSIPKFQHPSNVLSETDILSPSPSVWPQSTVIKIDGAPIRISWAKAKPEKVELYSNLQEQKLSEEIKINKSCQILVSGGFYSKENTHLGLFVSNFETVSTISQSATRNGFLWIDTDEKATISSDPPSITPRLALQSGPLLMQAEQPLPLAINNDEPKRRIAAAVTSDNKLIFLVFYREQSGFEGPMLGKLPEIIQMFKKQTDIEIVDAINLDGGNASVFISNYDLLRELAVIGSYFCVK